MDLDVDILFENLNDLRQYYLIQIEIAKTKHDNKALNYYTGKLDVVDMILGFTPTYIWFSTEPGFYKDFIEKNKHILEK